MYFIGVDLGTSAVKLLLMDEEGKIVNIVSREYPLYFPHPGWSEQKPEDWWEQSKEGIRELVKDVDKSQVAGISFGGQMHGLVILDENDNVIRPAILWNDGRTAKQTDYLNTVIGKEKLSEYTANIAFAGFTAPKILWVKENEPDNFAKICKIMLPKDYLAYRLSGAFVSDYSDASGMLLMDVKNKCWSKEMAEICGISLEMLPELHESFDAVGTLKPEAAAELGLPETCKVVAGAGDNAAAAVGTGTVGDGMCNVSLGTSGTVFISSNKFGVDSHNALHAFAHADGHYHLMGCMLSAASCNKWWMDEIIRTKEYTKEQENITKLGENNVFFLPYLMGERTPHLDPDCRGVFFGLSAIHTRKHLLRAVMEGVAYSLCDCNEILQEMGVKVDCMKACGGGGKSPVWRQMLADLYNCSVERVVQDEGPALGVAILAGVACGLYESVEKACDQLITRRDSTEPKAEDVAVYEKYHRLYQKLYTSLKNDYKELAELS